jgi:hypothetical protein
MGSNTAVSSWAVLDMGQQQAHAVADLSATSLAALSAGLHVRAACHHSQCLCAEEVACYVL